MTPEKAQALLRRLLYPPTSKEELEETRGGFTAAAPDLARAYIAQAKQIEAARVLAGEVGRVANLLICSGSNTAMTVALVAALAAYEESKK